MRSVPKSLILAVWVGLMVLCGSALAGQGPEKKDDAKKSDEKKIVRDYNNYNEDAVYTLSNEARVQPVRFRATCGEKLKYLPRSVRRMRVGKGIIDVGYAFQTEGDILCVVQKKDENLAKEADNLVKGQQLTIEGVTLPAEGGYKLVLVDNLVTGNKSAQTGVATEVIITWPGEKPKLLKQAGTYTLTLPDPNVKGKTISFKVELRQVRTSGK